MIFNEAQKNAVKHIGGPCLVLAGPGSGKTTVLTKRVKNLIEEAGVLPEKILVITFTKAAALTMEQRFKKICTSGKGVTFGTFHGVYFSILRAAYNYSVNNIITGDNRINTIRNAIEKSGLNPEDINEFTEQVAAEISSVKTGRLDIDAYYSTQCPEEEFRRIFRMYDNELKKSRLIDFDDMILYCYELLESRKDILSKWQSRFEYILVDEFQDINQIQYDVVKMLSLPENNLFIVGDDDQSIYGFRGSKPEIMLNFEKDYPGTKKIFLDINYRSTSNIVEAAGFVIKNNGTRFKKTIRTGNDKGDKVDIVEFNDIDEEYERVVEEIKNGIGSGKKYSDYAVLFRTNTVIAPLIRKLMGKNIPFAIKDGIPDIFGHWIASDIFAYADMAHGSRKRKDFLRIMNKPLRYISRDYINDREVDFDGLEKYYEDKPWMVQRIRKICDELDAMASMTPYAMINYLRKGVGYDDYIKEYAGNRGIEEQELYSVLDEIADSAKNFISYDAWLEYISEYRENLKKSAQKNKEKPDAVTLATMHGSKGLEYDTVFIIDANEGITPHKKAVFEHEIEEERRMFYVAMTRAENNLKIFYSRLRFNKKLEPSRFVLEIMGDNSKKGN